MKKYTSEKWRHVHYTQDIGKLPLCISGFTFGVQKGNGLLYIFRKVKENWSIRYVTCLAFERQYNAGTIYLQSEQLQDMLRACSMALVALRMISGEDLEPYYQFLERYSPEMVRELRLDVERRIQWLLEPLMRIRRRRFRSRCVARRWADRRWNPNTWIGQQRLLRDFEELTQYTNDYIRAKSTNLKPCLV